MSSSAEEDRCTWVMERSSCSQVVFWDVPQSYPPHTSVSCSFTVTGGLIPTSTDWIGVFKVGWNSTQQYHNYVWVNAPLENDGTEPLALQVAFDGYYLPKEDGEFYQFCYVDNSRQVRGASTPFCFQNPAESSPDSSLEKDLVVITTQEQAEQMEKEKKSLLMEIEQVKEEKTILKNELDDRLHEICRLRMQIDELKSDRTPETQPSNEQKPETVEEVTHEEPLLCDTLTVNETKQVQEVPSTLALQSAAITDLQDKYDKALQKISMLKQKKIDLEEQLEAQQAKNSQLDSKMKEAEQDFNKLQDHAQLLQVDVQSCRKENERLHSEIQESKREAEELRVENKALHETFSEQRPSDGENDTKTQLKEALSRADEQENMATRLQLEKEELSKENKKLKEEVQSLQAQLYELQVASLAAVAKPQPSPPSPSITDPPSLPHSGPHYFDSITETIGNSAEMENKKVCCHCQESFPGISEEELAMHEKSHKVCPFCTLICDDLKQQEFEDHVYGHE